MNIHHIGYLVGNLEKAVVEFQKLGYQIVMATTHDTIRYIDVCFLQMDKYIIELVSPYKKESIVYGLLKKYKNMPYHICYETSELEKELRYLEANGFTRMGEPCPAPALQGRRVCFLMSARVGMIELLEGKMKCQ